MPVTGKVSKKSKTDLKSSIKKTSSEIMPRLKLFKKESSPFLRASSSWRILSDQLLAILGPEIHRQWFANIRPIVISNNILILQTTGKNSSHWINTHYQNLVDLLLSFQDKELNSFFINSSDWESKFNEPKYSYVQNS
jgi:hypothetical protein